MSECACSLDLDVNNLPHYDVDNKLVSAKKRHKCCSCHQVISSGDKYERVKGVWDGKWKTLKTCVHCLSLRDTFICGSFYYESVYEDVMNHISEIINEHSEKIFEIDGEKRGFTNFEDAKSAVEAAYVFCEQFVRENADA